MDTQQVRSTALKSVFDIVHVYGLDAFSDADTSCDQSGGNNTEEELSKSMSRNSRAKSAQECSEDSRRGWSESASKVIAILSTALDLEVFNKTCFLFFCFITSLLYANYLIDLLSLTNIFTFFSLPFIHLNLE